MSVEKGEIVYDATTTTYKGKGLENFKLAVRSLARPSVTVEYKDPKTGELKTLSGIAERANDRFLKILNEEVFWATIKEGTLVRPPKGF